MFQDILRARGLTEHHISAQTTGLRSNLHHWHLTHVTSRGSKYRIRGAWALSYTQRVQVPKNWYLGPLRAGFLSQDLGFLRPGFGTVALPSFFGRSKEDPAENLTSECNGMQCTRVFSEIPGKGKSG